MPKEAHYTLKFTEILNTDFYKSDYYNNAASRDSDCLSGLDRVYQIQDRA